MKKDTLLSVKYSEYLWLCPICGNLYGEYNMTRDHFIPRVFLREKGYCYERCNIVAICYHCNRKKGHKIVTPDYYKYLPEHKQKLLWYIYKNACEKHQLLEWKGP